MIFYDLFLSFFFILYSNCSSPSHPSFLRGTQGSPWEGELDDCFPGKTGSWLSACSWSLCLGRKNPSPGGRIPCCRWLDDLIRFCNRGSFSLCSTGSSPPNSACVPFSEVCSFLSSDFSRSSYPTKKHHGLCLPVLSSSFICVLLCRS